MYEMLSKSLIDLNINGNIKSAVVRPADTLLYTLREQLGLTGTKNSCENGDCNTCTVLVDGLPVKACLMLTVEAQSHQITTIEGLKDTPIQKAFLEKSAVQCGFCTPGFIMNSYALVNLHPDADDDTINEWLQSNLCRCTSYSEIKEAVKSVLPKNQTGS